MTDQLRDIETRLLKLELSQPKKFRTNNREEEKKKLMAKLSRPKKLKTIKK